MFASKLIVLLAVISGAATLFAQNPQGVVINEVYTGNPDYVEITNFGGSAQDLTGWCLKSSFGFTVYTPYYFPTGTILDPGESVLVLELAAILPPTMSDPDPTTIIVQTGTAWGWVGNSSGTVVLADNFGQGRDLIVFGDDFTFVPGNGYGAVFNGTIPRGDNDPTNENAMFRFGPLDTDAVVDWVESVDAAATPGALNAGQSTEPVSIASLQFTPSSGVMTFDFQAQTFTASATISAVVTDYGLVLENPLYDPLIGGSVQFAGSFAGGGTDLEGITIGPATATITSTSALPDALTAVFLMHDSGVTGQDLGGAAGATPRYFRRLETLYTPSLSRTGGISHSLDSFYYELGTKSLIVEVEVGTSILRLEGMGWSLPDRPSDWSCAMANPVSGQIEIGVINAVPQAQLFHIFVVNPAYALGTGPIAGIVFGPMQFDMAVTPAGTHPFHVHPDSRGMYHFITPPGALPPGLTLDLLPVQLLDGNLEALAPIRKTIF